MEFNQPIQKTENLKPQADESVRIEVTLTAEQFQELEQAKNLLSHICPEGSWADVIGVLAKNYNQKKLGKNRDVNAAKDNCKSEVTLGSKSKNKNMSEYECNNNNNNNEHEDKSADKTPRVLKTTELYNSASTLTSNSHIQDKTTHSVLAKKFKPVPRKYISVHTKRELLTKANHCCEYLDPKTKKKCQSKYYLEIDHIHPVALGGKDDIKNLRILCRTHNNLAARQYGLNIL